MEPSGAVGDSAAQCIIFGLVLPDVPIVQRPRIQPFQG